MRQQPPLLDPTVYHASSKVRIGNRLPSEHAAYAALRTFQQSLILFYMARTQPERSDYVMANLVVVERVTAWRLRDSKLVRPQKHSPLLLGQAATTHSQSENQLGKLVSEELSTRN
jgi:hypothetical protein